MDSNNTAQIVKEILQQNVFLMDYLKRNLINVQGLARELIPQVKEKNPKATVESISIAIKRMSFNDDTSATEQLKKVLQNVQLSTRSHVTLFCLKKGSEIIPVSELKDNDIFFINQGANEVTIIVDDRNSHLIKGEVMLKQDNLALITLHDSTPYEDNNYRVTPGFVHVFVSNVSKRGINLNDILSTHSQVTLVVDQKYLLDVYRICENVTKLKYW